MSRLIREYIRHWTLISRPNLLYRIVARNEIIISNKRTYLAKFRFFIVNMFFITVNILMDEFFCNFTVYEKKQLSCEFGQVTLYDTIYE
jgi:hypothetical protein